MIGEGPVTLIESSSWEGHSMLFREGFPCELRESFPCYPVETKGLPFSLSLSLSHVFSTQWVPWNMAALKTELMWHSSEEVLA